MKIWAKIVSEEKIKKNLVYEYEHMENLDDFVSILQGICEQLDIPTPLATRVNFTHFFMFNNTRFKQRDFVESIDFDLLDIEAMPDKEKKQR